MTRQEPAEVAFLHYNTVPNLSCIELEIITAVFISLWNHG